MARVTTLAPMWWPLMGRPSVRLPYCPVCGRTGPLEQHHPVRRGAGSLYDEHGREVAKPTITLCGFGSNLAGADGRPYCHGLAHHNRLHFRWVEAEASLPRGKRPPGLETYSVAGGHWEYLLADEPTGYLEALELDGWRRLT